MSNAVVLKAGLVPLTTLSFSAADIDSIQQELATKKAEAPALFQNLPCVLDLSDAAQMLDVNALHTLCRDAGMLPVGVRNASEIQRQQASELGLADLGKGNARQAVKTSENTATETPQRSVKVHTGNVRSGQQLYTDGDLIILGMVSNGAEVLATGDIHIFGALRGRALAGVKGDEQAVIACQQFDAELVSVAGQYRLFEAAPEDHQKAVVVSLAEGNLNITSV